MMYLYEAAMLVLGLLVGWFFWRGNVRVPTFSSNIAVQILVIVVIAVVAIWIVGFMGLVLFIIGLIVGFFLRAGTSGSSRDWKRR